MLPPPPEGPTFMEALAAARQAIARGDLQATTPDSNRGAALGTRTGNAPSTSVGSRAVAAVDHPAPVLSEAQLRAAQTNLSKRSLSSNFLQRYMAHHSFMIPFLPALGAALDMETGAPKEKTHGMVLDFAIDMAKVDDLATALTLFSATALPFAKIEAIMPKSASEIELLRKEDPLAHNVGSIFCASIPVVSSRFIDPFLPLQRWDSSGESFLDFRRAGEGMRRTFREGAGNSGRVPLEAFLEVAIGRRL